MASPSLDWRRLTDDLSITSLNLSSASIFSSKIVAVRTGMKRFRPAVIRASEFGMRTATVKSLCKNSHGVVCINANFFDERSKPLGLIITRGTLHQKIHAGGQTLTGIFQVGRDSVKIQSRENFSSRAVLEAVQAGPRLVVQSRPVPGLKDSDSASNRSGVCLDDGGNLVLFGVFSGLVGVTLEELQENLLDGGLRCIDALNLDGGGSAQLYVSPSILGLSEEEEVYYPGRDEVPVALGLFVKE